jgi:hypothetical protein
MMLMMIVPETPPKPSQNPPHAPTINDPTTHKPHSDPQAAAAAAPASKKRKEQEPFILSFFSPFFSSPRWLVVPAGTACC